MIDDTTPSATTTFSYPDPLDKLPALAERLGVKEGADGTDGLVLHLRDGRRYAVLDLINALLDRIEKVVP